jgi:hypothetical protein
MVLRVVEIRTFDEVFRSRWFDILTGKVSLYTNSAKTREATASRPQNPVCLETCAA